MEAQEHWDAIYGSNPSERLSWYAPQLHLSLAWIELACPDRRAAVLDAGGGASTLAGDLLGRGYVNVSVLDLSRVAIERSRQRLGGLSDRVRWLVGDVTAIPLQAESLDVWHDRALFHFLIDPARRRAYVAQVERALRPGGQAILATFGVHGPARCSGLPVARYGAAELEREFGARFRLVEAREDSHRTPGGVEQAFLFCRFQLLPRRRS